MTVLPYDPATAMIESVAAAAAAAAHDSFLK